MTHRLNRDREMRMVGNAHRYGIDLVGHPVEHGPEILETRNFREHIDNLLRMRSTHIHIAQGDHLTKSGLIQLLGDLASSLSDTDKRDLNSLIRAHLPNSGMRFRDPKRRNRRQGGKRQRPFQERAARDFCRFHDVVRFNVIGR